MRLQSIISLAAAAGLAIIAVSPSVAAPAKKPAHKPAAANEVKGQGQVSGAYGQFGVTYSLKNQFNFTLLAAKYSVQPFIAYATLTAKTDEKVLVVDIAIKNAAKQDSWFSSDGLMTAVDAKGELYPLGSYALMSNNTNGSGITLKPGQGVGQPALNDPLQLACVLPAKARIVKIILNQGRLGKSEDVLRYPVSGATADEAGVAGDPKNAISPLPENARDAKDKSGAVALPEGIGKIGEYEPSGYFALRLDSFEYSTEAVNGTAPDDGKRFGVATVTAKLLTTAEDSMFDVTGGDFPLHELTDADGERSKPAYYRKAKHDEDPEFTFKQGDEYTFRIIFVLGKDTPAKKLVLGTGSSRKWLYDVSRTQ